jgi:hypothetical protein
MSIASLVIAAAGVTTGATAVRQYVRQGRDRRAEQFFIIGTRILDDPEVRQVLTALEGGGDPVLLSALPRRAKADFLAYCETVALLTKSGFIPESVAYYMLGTFAVSACEQELFWTDLDPESPHWALYRDFAASARGYWQSEPDLTKLRL